MTAKKPMKIVSVLLAFLVALSGSFVFSVAASHYSADHPEAVDSSLGRKELHSFFVNGQTDPNYPFPGFWQPDYLDDADNVNQFVSKVRSALNSNYSACRADFFPPNRNETADNWPSCFRRKALAMHAAFIVHTMLGDTASDWQAVCGGGATCYRAVEHPSEGARARFSQWEAHVRYYDSQGWADFNYMYTVQCEASWNSAHWGRDVSWINNGCGTSATYETIRFQRGPGDDPYTIVKFCGNTKGPVGSLRPPPDPVISCTSGVASRKVEPGQEFDMQVTFGFSPTPHDTFNFTTSHSLPGVAGGSRSPNSDSVSASGTSRTVTISNLRAVSTGTYNGQVTFETTDGLSATCGLRVDVHNLPFTQAFRGDVLAGAPIFNPADTNTCYKNDDARIDAYHQPDGDYHKGSGGQLGVLASGSITEFLSASLRATDATADDAKPPFGLTFANTGPGSPGNFEPFTTECPNYFAGYDADEITVGPVSLTSSDQTRHYDGDTSTNPGNNPINGGEQIFYVNGNLHITRNITYANSYSSVNDIPHVRFVVKGNIYIDRNVTELHGTYIAQPRDDGSGSLTGGEIYTCAFGFNNPREIESDLQRLVDAGPDGCASAQLRIFGSVVAKGIFLHRLNGTVNDATPQADYNTTSAGEIFVESPLNWLASPRNAPDAGLSDYDAISNPPPVL